MAEAVKADCETGHIRGIFFEVGGRCLRGLRREVFCGPKRQSLRFASLAVFSIGVLQ